YVSTDGGKTWLLNFIVPSRDRRAGTGDITLRFSGTNRLYAGILKLPSSNTRLNILRAKDFTAPERMVVLVDRLGVDQPSGEALTVGSGQDQGKDRVYVGNNDFNAPDNRTAAVDRSLDPGTAPSPAGFETFRLENRQADFGNGPQIRMAGHVGGKVYAVFYSWRRLKVLK